jgi:23S rRNA (cytidine1920-2'-O)/16S rRNA (cytidine1409-2'-O)-methyltransferase
VKERLDRLVVDRKLTDSRERAKAFIMAGSVSVNGETVRKPAALIDSSADIGIQKKRGGYVSRGGIKLEKPLVQFGIAVQDKLCIDIGASTGGFTDCLLQHGAQHVIAVDVGRNQLDYVLRRDPRVEVIEGFNAREINRLKLERAADVVTIDVSFISITLIIKPLLSIIHKQTDILCLIKPQFELEKPYTGFKGVVRESEKHRDILDRLHQFMICTGYDVLGATHSPIQGPKGNIEYFFHVRKGDGIGLDHSLLDRVVPDAHEHFISHRGDGND